MATTGYTPTAIDGTVKVQENAPDALVVWEVQVCVVGVVPLNVKVLIVVLGVNPDPVTITVVPTGPCLGARAIAGVVIVNVTGLADPPSLPAATTGYTPTAIDGTVKVQENAPDALVVWEVQVCMSGVVWLNVNVLMVVFGVYPDPVTITDIPLGP